jgi:nitrite reductase/ring-hydroxylating ferredoxin subunit
VSGARIFVAGLDGLVEGEARVFRFRRNGRALEGFVLCAEGTLVAYANVCPHWAVDLDMGEGRFWEPEQRRILCVNHGALFEPLTGVCERGPCYGDSLERFELTRDGSGGWVTVPGADTDAG